MSTRAALKNGLKIESEVGTNPYKFGLIDSTDSHTGLTTADDNNFRGKMPSREAAQNARSCNLEGSHEWGALYAAR